MSQLIDNPAGLLACARPGRVASSAVVHTDSAITEAEIQQIFRKSWSYIGPLAELANPGIM